MSSTIKLYEHNQKAYDALLDMLGERDRACVIKPTGTGKFVIIAKMVQDNPDKRFLLLGTNDYMFNDQKDCLRDSTTLLLSTRSLQKNIFPNSTAGLQRTSCL